MWYQYLAFFLLLCKYFSNIISLLLVTYSFIRSSIETTEDKWQTLIQDKRYYCLESDIRRGTYLFIYVLRIQRRYKRRKLCSPLQRISLAFALRDRKAKA